MRYWVLANMTEVDITGEIFEFDDTFDPREFASRSFGVFQEKPVDLTLRFDADAASDAGAFLFHPGQETAENAGGSMIVRFRASGSL